eukprot:TRINITY_DN5417_c0_g1_i1.p1 TRINITY_DN5417_c0_g1~~TRINITY_DN5417_c0_g1_i1.p1  ORF type:complete len:326 (-),score=60.31 TRINITY_DN5417_c0_g1_i1:1133-2077(-)
MFQASPQTLVSQQPQLQVQQAGANQSGQQNTPPQSPAAQPTQPPQQLQQQAQTQLQPQMQAPGTSTLQQPFTTATQQQQPQPQQQQQQQRLSISTLLDPQLGFHEALAVLPSTWAFWVTWKLDHPNRTAREVQKLGECSDLRGFWECFGRLMVSDMPANVSIHVLRQGAVPAVDAPVRLDGGSLAIDMATTAATTWWLRLAYAVVCEQVPHTEHVEGCAVSRGPNATTLQLLLTTHHKVVVDDVKHFLVSLVPKDQYTRIRFCPNRPMSVGPLGMANQMWTEEAAYLAGMRRQQPLYYPEMDYSMLDYGQYEGQ